LPDIAVSCENTLVFRQNLSVCRDPAVSLDLSDDYLIFDHQTEVEYTQEGTRDLQRDGRVIPSNSKTVHLCHVGRYKLTFRDLLSESSGHLKVGDIRAEISQKELDGLIPATGDKLVFPEGTYFAFAVDWDKMTLMYIVWCRK